MALTNLFKLFGESAASSSVYNNTDWNNLAERLSGFISGSVANSKTVNTAIKSNSLVSMGFVEAIKSYGSGSVGLSTSVSLLSSTFKSALESLSKSAVKNATTFTKTSGTPSTGDTLTLTINGASVNSVVIGNAANAGTATKATYDSSGSKNIRTYAASLTVDGSTITLKDADSNILSSGTISEVTQVAQATSAEKDGLLQDITSTYIKAISVNDFALQTVKGDGTYGAIQSIGDSYSALENDTTKSLVTRGEKFIWNNKGSGSVTSIILNAGDGISIANSGTAITTSGERTIVNTGVRVIAEGSTNGTISVNTNGTIADVAIKGLGSNAFSNAIIPAITLNGSVNNTPNFLAATTFHNGYFGKMWLLGNVYSASLVSQANHLGCYIDDGYLYSAYKKVSTSIIDVVEDHPSATIDWTVFEKSDRRIWILIPSGLQPYASYHYYTSASNISEVKLYGLSIIVHNANENVVRIIGSTKSGSSTTNLFNIDNNSYNCYQSYVQPVAYQIGISYGTLIQLV